MREFFCKNGYFCKVHFQGVSYGTKEMSSIFCGYKVCYEEIKYVVCCLHAVLNGIY